MNISRVAFFLSMLRKSSTETISWERIRREIPDGPDADYQADNLARKIAKETGMKITYKGAVVEEYER